MSDPLDPNRLISLLPSLLPRGSGSPLPRPTDGVAILVHAIHTALAFRLVQPPSDAASVQPAPSTAVPSGPTGQSEEEDDVDDGASETTTAVDPDDMEAPTTDNENENKLRQGWNDRGEESYTFQYRHEQSAMTFRVRVGRMGGRVQIDAMAEEGEPNTISVVLNDLLESSAFPIPGSGTAGSSNTGSGSAEQTASSLGYKSLSSITTFVEVYKRDIIARLLPGLQLPGYAEARPTDRRDPSASSGSSRTPVPARPNVPTPPFSDPTYDPLREPHGSSNPASVGRRDLDPFIHPPSGFNPNRDGGGMLVDFNHPLFDSRRRDGGSNPDFSGPGGSIQPPGSRWDPIGPAGFPGPGGNPLGGTGVGDRNRDRWGDELAPPGEFGPDLGGGLGGIGGPRRGGPGGPGGPGFGGGLGGMGGLGGGRQGGFGGFGGGGGGGMFM